MDDNVIRIPIPTAQHAFSTYNTKTAKKPRATARKNKTVLLNTLSSIENPAYQVLERRKANDENGILNGINPLDNGPIDSYHVSPANTGYAAPPPPPIASQTTQSDHLVNPPANPSEQAEPRKPVQWGCLKGGVLPTYRTFRLSHTPASSSTQSLTQYSTQSLTPSLTSAITNQTITPMSISNQPPPPPSYLTNALTAPTQLTQLTHPAPINSGSENPDSVTTQVTTTTALLERHRDECARNAPPPRMQKRTVRRTQQSGFSKNKKEMRVILNSATRKNPFAPGTEPANSEMNKAAPTLLDMKRVLVKRQILSPGTMAPADMIQELYKSAIETDQSWNN